MVAGAAPVDRGVRPLLRVNRREHDTLGVLLQAVRLEEREGGLATLSATFLNVVQRAEEAGLAFDDDRILRLGAQVELALSTEGSPSLFSGVITGLEERWSDAEAPTLTLLAEDGLQRLRMARRTARYPAGPAADLVRRLASGAGLQVNLDGLEVGLGEQLQHNESDLAFLRRVLYRVGFTLTLEDDTLRVRPAIGAATPRVTLRLGQSLRSARGLVDLAHQVTEVSVAGWDAAQGARVLAHSRPAELGPGRGRGGSAWLEEALGRRQEHLATAVGTQAEAQALADAAYADRARRFVTVEGCAAGDPTLRLGQTVRLEGLSRRFSGDLALCFVRHRYDLQRGYEVDFEACSAFLPEPT